MFKATAPGSLMLLGEYAVLHGKQSLVCAIDKRMTVLLQPRNDSLITIQSALGSFTTDKNKIVIQSPFQFVLTTLQEFAATMQTGCHIQIETEFSDQIGFASSASVTTALTCALSKWLQYPDDLESIAKKSRSIIQKVQGTGSGADVAACTYGGMIAYQSSPWSIEKFDASYPLTVIYSGVKTPTAKAIQIVDGHFENNKKLFSSICDGIDLCVKAGIKALAQKDWKNLGKMMNVQQGFLDALGVNTAKLSSIINKLREDKNIYGAKISGSGLGDCAIGLGKSLNTQLQIIPVAISSQGVSCEEI